MAHDTGMTLDFVPTIDQNAIMTRISIIRDSDSAEGGFRAFAGTRHSTGKTAGEALDAITAQLDDAESGTILVQQMRPDRFFTAEQMTRLRTLMDAWRVARDSGKPFPPDDQAELEALVEEELKGSARRTAALLGEPIP